MFVTKLGKTADSALRGFALRLSGHTQVQYLEARGSYILLRGEGQPHPMRTTLSKLARQRGADHFLRVLRSLMVNTNYFQGLPP
ncbi:LytTR family transcriptional regulator DNA-binding domain-containing protein [Hymenobacter sp. HD11105]